MTLDLDFTLEGQTVHITVNGGEWTLSRESDSMGEIFCEGTYLFIEDHTVGGYTAIAPLVGDGVRSVGDTKEAAKRRLEMTLDDHERTDSSRYSIEGRLSVETPENK